MHSYIIDAMGVHADESSQVEYTICNQFLQGCSGIAAQTICSLRQVMQAGKGLATDQ